jgi:DnaJ-domain-containing protein 1
VVLDMISIFIFSETLNPDLKNLENKFFELSKKYHPDRVGGDEEMSGTVNMGYGTLKDKRLLAEYLFKKNGIPEDKKNVPLELSEEYFDAEDDIQKNALKSKIEKIVEETKKQIDQIKITELTKLREKYTYLNYLESMIRNLEGNHDY